MPPKCETDDLVSCKVFWLSWPSWHDVVCGVVHKPQVTFTPSLFVDTFGFSAERNGYFFCLFVVYFSTSPVTKRMGKIIYLKIAEELCNTFSNGHNFFSTFLAQNGSFECHTQYSTRGSLLKTSSTFPSSFLYDRCIPSGEWQNNLFKPEWVIKVLLVSKNTRKSLSKFERHSNINWRKCTLQPLL